MLHDLLYRLRVNCGLSVLQVSHALHVSTVVVYCWERGDARPRAAHLAALMRLYRAREDQLDEVAHLAAFNAPRGAADYEARRAAGKEDEAGIALVDEMGRVS